MSLGVHCVIFRIIKVNESQFLRVVPQVCMPVFLKYILWSNDVFLLHLLRMFKKIYHYFTHNFFFNAKLSKLPYKKSKFVSLRILSYTIISI